MRCRRAVSYLIDLDAGKLAEAGIDPINRPLSAGGGRDTIGGGFDRRAAGGVESDRLLMPVNRCKLLQCGVAGCKDLYAHISPPTMRACSGLKPIR